MERISLKLLINTKTNKVIFAEVEKPFVDFLFTVLTLPTGTLINIIRESDQDEIGCLGSLYKSIQTFDSKCMLPNKVRDFVLRPKLPEIDRSTLSVLPYKPSVSSSVHRSLTLYRCPNFQERPVTCGKYVSDDCMACCRRCREELSLEMTYVFPDPRVKSIGEDEQGYVKTGVVYLVKDDLSVESLSAISTISVLKKFDVEDLDAVEEKVVEMGRAEVVKLLRASLLSNTALTYVFLVKEQAN